jgi:rubrerythrin
MISFPVFKSLTIEKYGLFPESLKHPYLVEFLPGQNAIVGVNGSGKSTMINIALRCLTGPFNLPAATSETELGQVRPKPVAMPRGERQLFARRVADGAAGATATIEVSFGAKTLQITRQLSNLSLIGCVVNDRLSDIASTDRHVHTDEAAYQDEIAGSFGIASFFDALIIFHFLIFMLEDRRSLVWDPSAQRQIFRVLLLSKERATEYATAQQEVISKDSNFRNTRQQIKKHGDQLVAVKTQAKNIKAADAERRVLNREAAAIRDQIEEVTQARLEADKGRQSARLDRLKSAESRESIVRELERLKIESLGSLLGPSQGTLRYVISQMLAEHRCLLCGTDPSPVAGQIDKWVRAGRCPICGSKHQVPEKVVPLTEAHRRRIERLEQELEYADKQIAEADTRIAAEVAEFEKHDDHYQKLEIKRLSVDARIVAVLRLTCH